MQINPYTSVIVTWNAFDPFVADLIDDGCHELRVGLLVGQELSNDLVHDVLWWEEVIQKLGQNPGHHPSLAG